MIDELAIATKTYQSIAYPEYYIILYKIISNYTRYLLAIHISTWKITMIYLEFR